jgi:hydrogenase maturation protease
MARRSVLLIGYGNPGRLDDGLGPRLAAAMEALALPGVDVDSDYQLTVEDAEAAARHEVVIFADAAVQGTEPFYFRRIQPGRMPGFSSHGVEPEEVLTLAATLFGAEPEAYVLGIRGYRFNEFGEDISAGAAQNLDAAAAFVEQVIREERFQESVRGDALDPAECALPGLSVN